MSRCASGPTNEVAECSCDVVIRPEELGQLGELGLSFGQSVPDQIWGPSSCDYLVLAGSIDDEDVTGPVIAARTGNRTHSIHK